MRSRSVCLMYLATARFPYASVLCEELSSFIPGAGPDPLAMISVFVARTHPNAPLWYVRDPSLTAQSSFVFLIFPSMPSTACVCWSSCCSHFSIDAMFVGNGVGCITRSSLMCTACHLHLVP